MYREKTNVTRKRELILIRRCRACQTCGTWKIVPVILFSFLFSFCLFANEMQEAELARLEKMRTTFEDEFRSQGLKTFEHQSLFEHKKTKFYVICWAYLPFFRTGGIHFSEGNITYYVVRHKTKDRPIANRQKSNDIMDMPSEYYPMSDLPHPLPKRPIYCLLVISCNMLNLKAFYWDNIIMPLGEKISDLTAEIAKDHKKSNDSKPDNAVPQKKETVSPEQKQQRTGPCAASAEEPQPRRLKPAPSQISFNGRNRKEDELLAYSIGYFKKGDPESQKKAAEFAAKAAELGASDAQWLLGQYYQMGTGVPQNMKEAVKWFRKAAEQGNPKAQRSLGGCYIQGNGVPQDPAEAVKWFRKAAEQYDADAQFVLGCCYAAGLGVVKDQEEAKTWLQKAAGQGHVKAEEMYEKLCHE